MLVLQGQPAVTAPPLLPQHRLLRLHLRNDGTAPLEVFRGDLRLLDAGGHDLRATFRPGRLTLAPGEEAGLDAVYHLREGTGEPAWLDHAGTALGLLSGARPA